MDAPLPKQRAAPTTSEQTLTNRQRKKLNAMLQQRRTLYPFSGESVLHGSVEQLLNALALPLLQQVNAFTLVGSTVANILGESIDSEDLDFHAEMPADLKATKIEPFNQKLDDEVSLFLRQLIDQAGLNDTVDPKNFYYTSLIFCSDVQIYLLTVGATPIKPDDQAFRIDLAITYHNLSRGLFLLGRGEIDLLPRLQKAAKPKLRVWCIGDSSFDQMKQAIQNRELTEPEVEKKYRAVFRYVKMLCSKSLHRNPSLEIGLCKRLRVDFPSLFLAGGSVDTSAFERELNRLLPTNAMERQNVLLFWTNLLADAELPKPTRTALIRILHKRFLHTQPQDALQATLLEKAGLEGQFAVLHAAVTFAEAAANCLLAKPLWHGSRLGPDEASRTLRSSIALSPHCYLPSPYTHQKDISWINLLMRYNRLKALGQSVDDIVLWLGSSEQEVMGKLYMKLIKQRSDSLAHFFSVANYDFAKQHNLLKQTRLKLQGEASPFPHTWLTPGELTVTVTQKNLQQMVTHMGFFSPETAEKLPLIPTTKSLVKGIASWEDPRWDIHGLCLLTALQHEQADDENRILAWTFVQRFVQTSNKPMEILFALGKQWGGAIQKAMRARSISQLIAIAAQSDNPIDVTIARQWFDAEKQESRKLNVDMIQGLAQFNDKVPDAIDLAETLSRKSYLPVGDTSLQLCLQLLKKTTNGNREKMVQIAASEIGKIRQKSPTLRALLAEMSTTHPKVAENAKQRANTMINPRERGAYYQNLLNNHAMLFAAEQDNWLEAFQPDPKTVLQAIVTAQSVQKPDWIAQRLLYLAQHDVWKQESFNREILSVCLDTLEQLPHNSLPLLLVTPEDDTSERRSLVALRIAATHPEEGLPIVVKEVKRKFSSQEWIQSRLTAFTKVAEQAPKKEVLQLWSLIKQAYQEDWLSTLPPTIISSVIRKVRSKDMLNEVTELIEQQSGSAQGHFLVGQACAYANSQQIDQAKQLMVRLREDRQFKNTFKAECLYLFAYYNHGNAQLVMWSATEAEKHLKTKTDFHVRLRYLTCTALVNRGSYDAAERYRTLPNTEWPYSTPLGKSLGKEYVELLLRQLTTNTAPTPKMLTYATGLLQSLDKESHAWKPPKDAFLRALAGEIDHIENYYLNLNKQFMEVMTGQIRGDYFNSAANGWLLLSMMLRRKDKTPRFPFSVPKKIYHDAVSKLNRFFDNEAPVSTPCLYYALQDPALRGDTERTKLREELMAVVFTALFKHANEVIDAPRNITKWGFKDGTLSLTAREPVIQPTYHCVYHLATGKMEEESPELIWKYTQKTIETIKSSAKRTKEQHLRAIFAAQAFALIAWFEGRAATAKTQHPDKRASMLVGTIYLLTQSPNSLHWLIANDLYIFASRRIPSSKDAASASLADVKQAVVKKMRHWVPNVTEPLECYTLSKEKLGFVYRRDCLKGPPLWSLSPQPDARIGEDSFQQLDTVASERTDTAKKRRRRRRRSRTKSD